MGDRLGYRARFGVLVPAFNASLQPELDMMRPVGVTNHVARIDVADGPLTNEAEQTELVQQVGAGVPSALRQVLAIAPAAVLHGVSIPTFWDGPDGSRRLMATLQRLAGAPVVLGAMACEAALEKLGRPHRLGIVTPYQPNGDAAVASYFETLGFDVPLVHSLRSPGHAAIAHADSTQIVDAFKTVYAAGVDAIVQAGTNIAAVDLAAEAERWLGVPVISINAAIYWHGLRQCGIEDRLPGFGRLLEQY
jgi:maleate isomerase